MFGIDSLPHWAQQNAAWSRGPLQYRCTRHTARMPSALAHPSYLRAQGRNPQPSVAETADFTPQCHEP